MVNLQLICDTKRHLICTPYSIQNLHMMADFLNIKRCWFHNGKHPHYDIPKKRMRDVMAQCEILSTKDLIHIINSYKHK